MYVICCPSSASISELCVLNERCASFASLKMNVFNECAICTAFIKCVFNEHCKLCFHKTTQSEWNEMKVVEGEF